MTLTIIGTDAGLLPPLRVWIPGRPQTAGSKTAMPVKTTGGATKTVVVESGTSNSRKAKKTWRGDLRDGAMGALVESVGWQGAAPTDRALEATFVFVLRRPGAHLRTGRHAGEVKDWAVGLRPTQRPDALKLARAAEDALTGVVWLDDSQIVEERLSKVYGDQAGGSVQTEGLLLVVREARGYPGPVLAPSG